MFVNRASSALTMNVTWKQLDMVDHVHGYELFDVPRQDKINETRSEAYFEAKVPSHDGMLLWCHTMCAAHNSF